jgi:ferredoxin
VIRVETMLAPPAEAQAVLDAGLNALPSRDRAGNCGECESVHPVAMIGVEYDAGPQGGAPALGTANHVNYHKSTYGQAVSPKDVPEQPNA